MAPVPSENARFDISKQHSTDILLSLIKLKSKLKQRNQVYDTDKRDLSSDETIESFLSIESEYELMKLPKSSTFFKSDLDLYSKSNDYCPRVLCAKNQLNSKSPLKASGQKLLQTSALKLIMSKSDMPMGDLNNMGLQKSNSEVLSQETTLFCKEKSYGSEIEQLFKQLGPEMLPDCNSSIGASGMENVEEILQVIKNLDANNASEPMSCDDPVEMDNMVSGGNNENEVIFPMADSADIAGSLSNFFNEVDMMGICVDDNLTDNQFSKDTKLKDKLNEIQKRQFHLQRKNEWLLRRMRKMQARAMTKQASEDVVSFLEYASNSSSEPTSLKSSLNSHNSLMNDTKTLKKKIPYANTSVFFRRLEQSLKQRHSVPSLKSSVKYFGSGSSCIVPRGITVVTPKLNVEVRSELERVSGTSLAHLEAVGSALDSDATASSSGAESCDEMQNFNSQPKQYLPIAKRSLWKYVKDRALIGSKWVWLQAQIADLQYKIREYDEFLNKVKVSKKCVELKSDCGGVSGVVINGYHGSLPGAVPGFNKEDDDNVIHCARTQPFSRSSFSNRKLGRVTDIYKISKKPIKLPTVMCRCTSLLTCILCAGSKNTVAQVPKQLPDGSLPERIAALDPGFHPILSFSSDVSLSTHLNSLMRVPEWQQGVSRMSVKSYSLVRNSDFSSDSMNPEKRLKLAPSVEMFQHRKKLNTLRNSSLHGSGMKKKPGIRGRKPKILKENLGYGHTVEKVKAKRAVAVRSMDDEQILVSETGSDIHISPPESPVHNQSTSVAKVPDRNEFIRRKRENSYDIDNIVIPYSVAAMTRVEKLPYKEILTPKWRVIDEETLMDMKSSEITTPSQDSDCEDISEDAVTLRHERCEKEERVKFRSYLKPSGMSRHRHRRLDNPDSMDFESSSPMTTPPATPQPVIESVCDQVILRKRAPSVTKKDKDDVNSPVDCDEVAPYEPREFPLSDEIYKKMLEDNIETTRHLRYTPQYFPVSSTTVSTPDEPMDQSRNMSSASSGSGDSFNLTLEDTNDPDWTTSFCNRRKD